MSDHDFQYALLLQKQFEHESKSPTTSFHDRELAMLLQQQFEQEAATENPKALVSNSKTHSTTKDTTKSLVDSSWEIIDPTPDIHLLFVAFNERFFWDKLLTVCVSWSKRMTSCAGICSYQGRGGMCSITLSEPLLKLRPRKDLVETLLHEMIHAYLFVTNNNRDRDGHGPEFHKHMFRINKEAGTNITVYHSFYDEVRLYQQHWWRCNGPCQHRKPFFGMVRRATNRAPGPNDRWWAEHSRSCGGEFIKVREPDKKKKTSNKENKDKKPSSSQKNGIVNYFPVLQNKNRGESSGNIHGFDGSGNITSINTRNNNRTKSQATTSTKKNSTSTIVITKNKNATATVTKDKTEPPKTVNTMNKKISPKTVGGTTQTKNDDYSVVRNHWLNKFKDKKRVPEERGEPESKKPKTEMVSCPVCHEQLSINLIDGHLDDCLKTQSEEKVEENGECVICGDFYPKSNLEKHVSECVNQSFGDHFGLIECEVCNRTMRKIEFKQHVKNCSAKQKERACVICNEKIEERCFDSHVEQCIHKMSGVERSNSKNEIASTKGEVVVIEDDEDCIRHGFENSYLNDDEEKKYNCPFCFKMFLEIEMCDHLSECVKSQVDAEEELDKIVLLDDLSNADF